MRTIKKEKERERESQGDQKIAGHLKETEAENKVQFKIKLKLYERYHVISVFE